jgi:peptidyl-prolyl cis-trans isomerase SurA
MTLRILRTSAAFVFGTALLATSALAQTRPAAPESPYGGTTVADIVARVNDQVITSSDYDRAMKELDAEARQHGASMQEISAAHKDLLRNLIDQQLWLSKGKELSINGETELVKRLDEIRKQYNLETLEDLEKAAKEQGVSYEDFKANIRNGIITQLVMRQQVGEKVRITPGEAERYFEQHKQEYAQQESVRLSEILVSIGAPAPSVLEQGAVQPDDPEKLAAAKAKADDIAARLHAGGDFAQLAKSFSDGPTAAEGGDLGQFKRGSLAKVLEDQTFALKSGQFTEPIRTKQGYVVLKVVEHIPGGVPAFKDVQEEVEQNFYMSRMEPAKPVYSAYTPPAPKKKKKVERTRFRETTRTFRQKSQQAAAAPAPEAAAAPAPAKNKGKKNASAETTATMKPGKKEKIRFGQAPTKTLPNAPETKVENAGALPPETASAAQEPVNPLESNAKPEQKIRYSARAKQLKQRKAKGPQPDALAPPAPDAAEVADRQTQAGPLGLAGDTAAKKKKKATTTGDKTRLANKTKKAETPQGDVPLAPAPQTPAPAPQTQ